MNNWTIIITFIYPHEAHLAKGVLESEEVEVLLKDELTAQVNNFYSTAIGGVKLLVKEEDRERAQEILERAGYIRDEQAEEKSHLEQFSSDHKTVCPYCHSNEVSRKKTPGYLVILSFLLLGALLPFLKKSYHCFDCGKEWRVKSH